MRLKDGSGLGTKQGLALAFQPFSHFSGHPAIQKSPKQTKPLEYLLKLSMPRNHVSNDSVFALFKHQGLCSRHTEMYTYT